MKKRQKRVLAVGAGLAGLAAAAAGVYMLTGKNAKNRKKVAKWVGDMQNDILRDLGKAGKVSKATYNKVVDAAAKNYKGLRNVSKEELAMVAAELKSSWDSISSELSSASKTVRRVVPKAARSIARKVKVNTGQPARKKTKKKAASKKKSARKARR